MGAGLFPACRCLAEEQALQHPQKANGESLPPPIPHPITLRQGEAPISRSWRGKVPGAVLPEHLLRFRWGSYFRQLPDSQRPTFPRPCVHKSPSQQQPFQLPIIRPRAATGGLPGSWGKGPQRRPEGWRGALSAAKGLGRPLPRGFASSPLQHAEQGKLASSGALGLWPAAGAKAFLKKKTDLGRSRCKG